MHAGQQLCSNACSVCGDVQPCCLPAVCAFEEEVSGAQKEVQLVALETISEVNHWTASSMESIHASSFTHGACSRLCNVKDILCKWFQPHSASCSNHFLHSEGIQVGCDIEKVLLWALKDCTRKNLFPNNTV